MYERKLITLITGSDQGLGLAIRSLLDQTGNYQTVNLGRDVIDAPFDQLKSCIERKIANVLYVTGHIDIVINNYGINHLSWIGTTSESDAYILQTNVMAPYWVVNYLVQQDQVCQCINIGSQTYRVPQRCTTLYAASKAALVSMTRNMARELASAGWQVNCLCPGKIEDTQMSHLTDAQVLELRGWTEANANHYALQQIPMKRFTDTKEVAQAVLQLLQLPRYVTGSIIDMMGGI